MEIGKGKRKGTEGARCMNKSRHKETIAHTQKITLWLNFDAKDAEAEAEEKLQAREEQEAAAAALARGQTAAGSSQAGDNKPNVAGIVAFNPTANEDDYDT
ncbi:hypothetical protein WR25_18451 [Diploscapter pachys]|uniref:Uncharacterized protein n=1 Tax=Diploscapter pachys TaxID=2018661 RepID=A0A2A2L8A4_9BILA|nr:hypothetical protein WR25_18451 [Diploscapter pachys]